MHYFHHWFILAAVVLLSAACTSEFSVVNKPLLAKWDPGQSDAFSDSTVGMGMLDINNGCVQLMLDNQKTILLVWPEPTSWNPSSQAIEFVGVRGERYELRDGDQIVPGGAPLVGEPQYTSQPYPSCKTDETFIVNSVQIVQD